MLKKSLLVVLAAALSSVAITAQADKSEGGGTARQGVMRCGGNNFLRLGGTEIQFATWVFRNFDSNNDITIDRMRVFDANGAVLFDSQASGLPLSEPGNIGPGNNVLLANQGTQFLSDEIIPFLSQAQRPVQIEVNWSSPRAALTLDGITVRVSRGRNATTGQQLEERGRHAVECRTISTR
jgi:hypothetical protein